MEFYPGTPNDLERELYQIGIWAVQSMQCIGYLPVRFTGNPGFERSWRGIVRALTLTVLSILWYLNYFRKRRRFARLNRLFGSTELFAHTLVLVTTLVVTTYQRLFGLLRMNKAIAFWKQNVRTLEIITMGGIEINGKYCSLFQHIRQELQRVVLMLFIPSIMHLIGYYSYRIWNVVQSKPAFWEFQLELHIVSAFWVFTSFFHAAHCVWMLFFIKLYTASFRIISMNLDELSRSGNGEHFKGTKNPEIYFAEIFYDLKWHNDPAFVSSVQENRLFDLKVRKCIHLVQILEGQLRDFNRFFATSLIFDFLNWIVHILGGSFFTCLWISRGRPVNAIPLIVPLFTYNAQLYHMGTEASRLTKAAQRITKNFHNLPLHKLTAETKIKIQLLVTSICTNPPVISAGHFFIVNRPLITSVLCAMTTFLVVLVQFKETDESSMALSPMMLIKSNGTEQLPPRPSLPT